MYLAKWWRLARRSSCLPPPPTLYRALFSSMPSMDPENRTLTSPLSGDPQPHRAAEQRRTRCRARGAVCAE